MQIIDYARSFVAFVLPSNTARLQLEARCLLTLPGQDPTEYLMFASCKSEDCYVATGLFRDGRDNYDFSGIFGGTRYRLERIHADASAESFDAGDTIPRFEALLRHVHEPKSVRPLLDKSAVIEATLANEVIIARNDLTDERTGIRAVVEYPVKTMNVQREQGVFQVDTGPVPLYNFAGDDPDPMAHFLWSYVAFNEFTGAFFISQVPTPLFKDGVEVARTSHYSQNSAYLQSVNTLFAIDD
jgi:hypothetical protein